MIQHDIYVNSIDVLPSVDGYQNVVVKVNWEFILTDGTHMSRGAGVTELDTANITDFVSAENLTEAQVAQWVKDALNATGTYNQLVAFHTQEIERKAAVLQSTRWTQPLLEPKVRPTVSEPVYIAGA